MKSTFVKLSSNKTNTSPLSYEHSEFNLNNKTLNISQSFELKILEPNLFNLLTKDGFSFVANNGLGLVAQLKSADLHWEIKLSSSSKVKVSQFSHAPLLECPPVN